MRHRGWETVLPEELSNGFQVETYTIFKKRHAFPAIICT